MHFFQRKITQSTKSIGDLTALGAFSYKNRPQKTAFSDWCFNNMEVFPIIVVFNLRCFVQTSKASIVTPRAL